MTEDSNDGIQLTRRQILASTSAIGLAGAGAGLGTSAYFSDTETFEENTLAAGELDLVVDWEEHYSFPQGIDDEFGDPRANLDHDVVRSEPDEDGYVGFPDPENPMVWIHEDDVPQYMANTAIEAFPDPDGDGQQEVQIEDQEFIYEPCTDGANLPEHLDPSGLRTDNTDTRGEAEETAPLVNLQDVKPGDFGEFTLSFHLCDNPGYVWLQADNVSESENGLTEPEEKVDETPETGELAENIQTAWWYDSNGNNVIDESIGAVDVMIAVDTSGSLTGSDVQMLEDEANTLASQLVTTGNARVGGLSFGGGAIGDFVGLEDGPVKFSGLSANGDTPMPAALEIAAAELDDNGRSGADTFIVLLTDGGPNYENKTYSAGGHTVGQDYTEAVPNSAVDDSELCETATIAETIRQDHTILTVGVDDDGNPTGNENPQDCTGTEISSLSQYLRVYIAGDDADYFQAEDPEAVGAIIDAILAAIAMSEEVFHRGTLADDLALLQSGDGLPLDGEPDSAFDELEDPPSERECFQPGVPYYIGFAWWLPLDVGNEIQSDGVADRHETYPAHRGHDGRPGSESDS
jgi:predicted ribosomally synthesized peptide with SipW-like signal peptide